MTTDYRRNYPMRGRRVLRGVFIEGRILELSLEAIGLAAHILTLDSDDISSGFLESMFPGRDISGPLKELASAGLLELLPDGTPPLESEVAAARAAETERLAAVGVIYLFEAGGRFKIGITKSLKARVKSVQTGSPFELRIVHSAVVADSAEAERIAHSLLGRFRLHGEWFDCTEQQALRAMDAAIEAVGAP